MAYDAFTIDTNMAIQGGLNLEAGLLGQLTQFKDGQIDLVLSEIVVREIRKHLVLQVKKIRDTLISAATRAEEIQLTEGDGATELKAKVEALGEPREIAGARLKKYIEATGATTIPVKLASMDELVKSYFPQRRRSMPPAQRRASFPTQSRFSRSKPGQGRRQRKSLPYRRMEAGPSSRQPPSISMSKRISRRRSRLCRSMRMKRRHASLRS